MEFVNSLAFANEADSKDELKSFRNRFFIPQHNVKDVIYFCGNSLGLQPKSVKENLQQELSDWEKLAVDGHFDAKHPWFSYKEILTASVARLLGAKPVEVVVMNSLTVNLHLLLVSFYRPTKHRYKIICEYDAFPSDIYALQSQIQFHGFNVEDALVMLKPRRGEYTLRTKDILKAIDDCGNTLATVMFGAVNYYTGQVFEMNKIVSAAHYVGATCGFNLAHAAGNIILNLHEWDVDYACFCSYKYLNAGPGSVAGIFVNEKHVTDNSLPRFSGWWGNDPATRFKMEKNFVPHPSASAWALSNDPVFSMAALKASLDIFDEAGIKNLRAKSKQLTYFLELIINEINSKTKNQKSKIKIKIITPHKVHEHGCQLSLIIPKKGKQIYEGLTNRGVVADWREPDVIRVAPVPLYNTFEDVFRFGEILEEEMNK
jgi:kynureninase